MGKHNELSTIEIRNLMLQTLEYEEGDIDSEGKTFKKYGYQGSRADLFRLMERLAIKYDIIDSEVPLCEAAWGGSGRMLYAKSTTNFSKKEINNIYESFHILLNQGIISPGAGGNMGPDLPYFHVTDYGLECLKCNEVLPYDIDGYLRKIRGVEGSNEWAEFYIKEALQCFNANCFEAAVVMMGLSAEKLLEDQLLAIKNFINKNIPEYKEEISKKIERARFASQKYKLYIECFEKVKKHIDENEVLSKLPQMDSVAQTVYSNFNRIIRNEMAHPSQLRMERSEVLMNFIAFSKYYETQYMFIRYFNQ